MPRAPDRRPSRGFTVVELIVVLLIAATLALIAVPQLYAIVMAQRLRSAAGDLVSSLYLARSEAIKRNGNVAVRPMAGDLWTTGWTVVDADDELLNQRGAPGKGVLVTGAPPAIVYTPSGRLDPLGILRVELSDVDGHPGISARCVIVDTAGVPRVEPRTCA